MTNVLKRYWFFLGMALMVALAFGWPAVGAVIKRWQILNVGVFLCFVFTGLTLPTSRLLAEVRNFRGLFAAVVSCFVVFPALAFVAGRLLYADNMELYVGMCLLGVIPVTIASGIVLTTVARGNVPLSLLITVSTNLLSIMTVPFSLSLLLGLGQEVSLPVGRMIQSLVTIVLLPTVIGQVGRIWLRERIGPYRKGFSVFSQLVVLLVILNGVASSTQRIKGLGAGVLGICVLVLALHAVVLAYNFWICRLLRLDLGSTAAFTIHVSQKSLTISFIVWSGYLATAYPLALVPSIMYHLTQLIVDAFVAERFGRALAGSRGSCG